MEIGVIIMEIGVTSANTSTEVAAKSPCFSKGTSEAVLLQKKMGKNILSLLTCEIRTILRSVGAIPT